MPSYAVKDVAGVCIVTPNSTEGYSGPYRLGCRVDSLKVVAIDRRVCLNAIIFGRFKFACYGNIIKGVLFAT